MKNPKYPLLVCASLAFAGTGLLVAVPPPPLVFTNLSCPGGRYANYTLQAWPGDYSILATTNLEDGWTNEIDIAVSASGAYAGVIPMQDRSLLFLRAMGRSPSDGLGCVAQFTTQGSAFEPDIGVQGAPAEFVWYWSDGTTSTNRPVASVSFGSNARRVQGLLVDPASAIVSINLGFDGADGGDTTPLPHRAGQRVSAVRIPYPLPSLRWWASSYNPIASTLNFSMHPNLEAIECFNCTPLQHVVVTNLPALTRVCFEDCDLRELDLSGNPNLGDVRGAVNAFTSIVTGNGTGPNIWHWCTRDNPQLTQRFSDIMTNFFSLRELYIWNDNQHGPLVTGSTNLTDVQIFDNHLTSADFTGQSRMTRCIAFNNDLTNLVVTGCTGLWELNAADNELTTAALDHVLATLDASAPGLAIVNLSHNPEFPSSAGYAHATNLINRGVSVTLDWGTNAPPDPGGPPGTMTFVTTSQNPHLQVQTLNGTPLTSIVWHWGDGATNSGTLAASHDFGSAGVWTNTVEVTPAARVSYFGAQGEFQGIQAVSGLTNFPNLNFLYLYNESVTELSLAGCTNLRQLHFAGNPVGTAVCDQWFIDLDAAVTGPVSGADFYYPETARSSASDAAAASLAAKGFVLHPPISVTPPPVTNNFTGGTNAVMFTTTSGQPHMEIRVSSTPDSIIWHWGDGTTTVGATVASHDFGATGYRTNWVEVTPPECVTYFGAQGGYTGQGIQGVYHLTNFPNLNYLFLYQESVTELSPASCANLRQLHLAANPVSSAVCDQWFVDLDAAVTNHVTGADFYYPAAARTSASDAARTSLIGKGFNMIPL